MNYQKLSWLSSLVVLGTIASTLPVVAETNQSDTSGGQTYSAPTVSIDSNNGNGIPTDTQYNPNTGEIIGGGINEPIQFDSAVAQEVLLALATAMLIILIQPQLILLQLITVAKTALAILLLILATDKVATV